MAFAKFWEDRLDRIDRGTNWTNRNFIALAAEVEVHSLDRNQRRVGDIVQVLRGEEKKADNPILILGEPGSGKSVVLRRLCRELLKETPDKDRLPIYVNLKNWTSSSRWDEETPPTAADLRDYIKSYLHREADDLFADRFLNENFETMLKKGTMYFILDSFDEIPTVMDGAEKSWIVDALSDVIGKFLRGAHASRGIVASRYFKRPTKSLAPGAIYRIKPFDDVRIRTVLQVVGQRTDADIREVFRLRPDLVSAAANPLIGNLLATYVRESGGKWPARTFFLFDDYIHRQLTDDAIRLRLQQSELTIEAVLSTSIAIASSMMESERYGLEIPVQVAIENLPNLPVAMTLHILKIARLGRLSSDMSPNFSFVHRRFQEYFVVVGMAVSEAIPDLEAIVSDTRYRDILALYCEVVPQPGANAVAVRCWNQIRKHWVAGWQNGDQIEAVQALRFLTEAFRARRDFTDEFLTELAMYIREQLQKGLNRPLTAKFASEAIALLDDRRAGELFPIALQYDSSWVRETAFRACRHFVTVPRVMQQAALNLVISYRYWPITGARLIRNHTDLSFSLSISDGFRSVSSMERAWVADAWIFATSLVILGVVSPIAAASVAGSMAIMNHLHRTPEHSTVLEMRGYILGCSTFLLFFLGFYFEGIGRVLEFPAWWPRNPLTVWEVALRDSETTFNKQWFIIIYRGLIGVSLLGLFPLAPKIAAARLWPKPAPVVVERVGSARISPSKACRMAIKAIKNAPWRKRLRFLSGFVIVLSSIILLTSVAQAVWNFLGEKIILVIVLCVIGLGLLYLVGWLGFGFLFRYRRDVKVLRACPITEKIQRQRIEEVLGLLKGQGARLRFVRGLLANHVDAIGSWRNDRFPFRPNDPVSDELIRLEERWLNLDH